MERASSRAGVTGPLVTVGIPSYRPNLDLFQRCLRSVENQAGIDFPYEILVVLDGEEENKELLDSGLLDGARGVRVITKEHAGEASARNTIIDAAFGRWLVFLDADDFLPPDALQALLSAAESCSPDFVSSNHSRVYPSGSEEVSYFRRWCDWRNEECAGYLKVVLSSGTDQGTVWAKAFRVSFLREKGLVLNTGLVNGVDQEFMVRCVLSASHIVAIPELTYHYVYNAGSIVRSFSPEYPRLLSDTIEQVRRDLSCFLGDDRVSLAFDQYVLDRFLMLVVNYLCHPRYCGGYADRAKDFRGAVKTDPYRTALKNIDYAQFSASRKVVLWLSSKGWFLPIRMIGWVRHVQLSGV